MDDDLVLSSSESDIDYASGGRLPAVRMTARQRALAARSGDDSDVAVDESDMGHAAAPVADAAAQPATSERDKLQREEQKRRRTDQRDARLQQTRAETIQRLLQKKGGRSAKRALAAPDAAGGEGEAAPRPAWTDLPVADDAVRVVIRPDGAAFAIGSSIQSVLPLAMGAPAPVAREVCAARDCRSPRTCVHPRTGRPMCSSLSCYRSLSAK